MFLMITANHHHLLAHTSGLPHKYAADGIIERERAVQAVLALPLQRKWATANNYPMTVTAIGGNVEMVSKRTFEDYLRKDQTSRT